MKSIRLYDLWWEAQLLDYDNFKSSIARDLFDVPITADNSIYTDNLHLTSIQNDLHRTDRQ